MPTKDVWLTKISETAGSLMESSIGYSTCQVMGWAPARPLLLSIPKSTCKISEKEPFALENKHMLKCNLKPDTQQNIKNVTNRHTPPCQLKG